MTQRITNALALASLRVVTLVQPARRWSEISASLNFADVVYVDVEFKGVCAGSTVDAFEDRQVGVEVTSAQATFSMSAKGLDAPQGLGKSVTHLVMALTRF